ncbi:Lactosylceramide 4-alpha-galactosyltransferase [Nymphon striatum]|nr:Lactosylceramide 4-alpha-galactosyltransferase [Nymphon striatum]
MIIPEILCMCLKGLCGCQKILEVDPSGEYEEDTEDTEEIQSASRHHPDLNITVYTTSIHGFFNNDSFSTILKSFANVKISKIDVETAVNGTPIEKWVAGNFWRYSDFLTEHISDIIRYAILWKQGGVYLDLDNIVLRDMSNLTNCAARDDENQVTNAVLIFSPQNKIISECMRLLPKQWTGQVFAEIGSNLITKVFKEVCRTDNLNGTTREMCEGSRLLPSKSFYVVPWKDWSYLFHRYWTESLLEEIIKHKSYSVHFYNKISKKRIVKFNSFSLIEVLAKNHCPKVYAEAKRLGKF